MKTLLISLLSLFALHYTVVGINPTGDAIEVLFIEAQTVELDGNCGNVTVTVSADGQVVDRFETSKKGNFEYYFEANTYYELLFEKEGYVTKRVDINTYTRKLKNSFHEFRFNVEMVQGSEDKHQNTAKIFVPKDSKKFTYAKL